MSNSQPKLLKKDVFGETRLHADDAGATIVRDAGKARPWARWIARRLLAREARALAALDGLPGIPGLVRVDTDTLERDYVAGSPLYVARPADPEFFDRAARLLRRMHRTGVVHNDLAKEPNVLVAEDGTPAFIDFQIAWYATRRTRLFRLLAREDLRHLLKHKRTYCAPHLTRRERDLLARPSIPSRLWMRAGKPVYLFVTRRLLGWSDRGSAADRSP